LTAKTSPKLSVVAPFAPPSRNSRPPKAKDAPSVVSQVRTALRPQNRLATSLGALLGVGVPVGSYQLAHHEVDAGSSLLWQVPAWLVVGGLLFSALTVYRWGRVAFASPTKAVGFCVLLEGVLVFSSTPWLSFGALVYLCAINAVATGCNLSRAAGHG
jgi:hypothetical protein